MSIRDQSTGFSVNLQVKIQNYHNTVGDYENHEETAFHPSLI
jgi:hypothetical protein